MQKHTFNTAVIFSLVVVTSGASIMAWNQEKLQASLQDSIKTSGSSHVSVKSLASRLKATEHSYAYLLGLALMFVIFVSLVFKRYRNKGIRRAYRWVKGTSSSLRNKKKNFSFTPTLFSSDSSPAILVADHDEEARLITTNTLRLNYRVIVADDTDEAFEKAYDMVPDLIIIRESLPGVSHSAFVQKLKATIATSHVPIIVIGNSTASLNSDLHRTEMVNDYIPGELDARELLMRVNAVLDQQKRVQDLNRKAKALFNSSIDFGDVFLGRLVRVLEKHHSDPAFDVDGLTVEMEMSKVQLFRKVKALTTYSPSDLLKNYRLEKAKQLLSRDDITITDVAAKTGFSNLSSFSKTFREFTGKTPVDFSSYYREKIKPS